MLQVYPHTHTHTHTQPYGGGMFGRSLAETMEVEARLGGQFVPILLHRCVSFLRERGEYQTLLKLILVLHVP